jgi:hypothetical protein
MSFPARISQRRIEVTAVMTRNFPGDASQKRQPSLARVCP